MQLFFPTSSPTFPCRPVLRLRYLLVDPGKPCLINKVLHVLLFRVLATPPVFFPASPAMFRIR
jgi:hypothetical protein